MAVESKVIVTAEDRTRAAFASMERNAGRSSNALRGLANTAMKLAGVGTLVVWFKRNAESTEKFSDEMAKLNKVTEDFFATMAESGALDPLIYTVKVATSAAAGLAMAFGKLVDGVQAVYSAVKLSLFSSQTEAAKVLSDWKKSVDEADAAYQRFNQRLFEEAPKGFAKQEEAAKKAAEAAKRLAEQRLRDRIKQTEENARAAEDAIRAEMEISDGLSAPGLTLVGEEVYNEARAKEAERLAEQTEKQREHLQKAVEQISESFLTEQEQMIMQYETRQMIIDEAFMQEMISAEEHTRQRQELELQHQAALGDLHAQGVLARRRFEEMNVRAQVKNVLGSLLQLTAGVAANNRVMFQINKVAGIANAIINTYEGVSKALSAYPPPLSFVMAAAQLGAGLAAVQQIRSASFGTATSAPSIGGGGATPVTNIPDLSSQAPAQKPTQVTIFMPSDSETLSRDWFVNKFVPTWNQGVGDGAPLIRIG